MTIQKNNLMFACVASHLTAVDPYFGLLFYMVCVYLPKIGGLMDFSADLGYILSTLLPMMAKDMRNVAHRGTETTLKVTQIHITAYRFI